MGPVRKVKLLDRGDKVQTRQVCVLTAFSIQSVSQTEQTVRECLGP